MSLDPRNSSFVLTDTDEYFQIGNILQSPSTLLKYNSFYSINNPKNIFKFKNFYYFYLYFQCTLQVN